MGKNLKDHNSIRSNELYTARSQFNDSSFPVHNNYNQHDQVAETIKQRAEPAHVEVIVTDLAKKQQ